MRIVLALLAFALLSTLVSGCAVHAPVVPPLAGVYTDIRAPLDVDFEATKVAPKKGVSSSMCILGLVATGDASTEAAAREGGISTIHSADYSYFNVLGVYQRYETIVHGE